MTIDIIVEKVFADLSKGLGLRRVRDTDDVVNRLNATAIAGGKERSRLRTRPGVSFSVNTTQAQKDPLTISVRVQGVDCGSVCFEQSRRMFRPNKNKKFSQHWTFIEAALEWGEPRVATFLKACVREAGDRYSQRESSIQDSLFRLMTGGAGKKIHLRGFQPVLFGRIPIQIALPVTPRGRSASTGKHKGHGDVIARSREHGKLVVFEVKRPGASSNECVEALAQAVEYAAALDYLMSRDKHRPAYWRLFDSRRDRRHKPRFSSIAFLPEMGVATYERIRNRRDELLRGNSRDYDLSVMFYRQAGSRIEVVREIPASGDRVASKGLPPERFGCRICWPASAATAYKATRTIEDTLVDDSHFQVVIRNCPMCSQRFVSVFTEMIDWAGGEDPQSRTLLPVTAAEAAVLHRRGSAVTGTELSALGPGRKSLLYVWPKGERSHVFWGMGLVILPHD